MNMGVKLMYFLAILLICINLNLVDSTKCKPYSKFKIDCNLCQCGEDGTKYFCTRWPCEQIMDFLNDEGYNLEEKNVMDDDFLPMHSNVLNEENNYEDLLDEANDNENDQRMIPNKMDAEVLYNDLQNLEKDNNDKTFLI